MHSNASFLYLLAPLVGGLASGASAGSDAGSRSWYDALRKPEWTPPKWAYGPVWTALYLSIGYAAYRVHESGRASPAVLAAFWASMALNWAWTPTFFGRRDPESALVVAGAMLVTALLVTASFWSVDRPAAGLAGAYAAWVAFATVLNARVVSLNSSSSV